MGLQHRSRSHHPVLQILQLLKGTWLFFLAPFLLLTAVQTTPAKVLSMNPGLKNISYSITGGALAAQGKRSTYLEESDPDAHIGYWMPFQCAKAVAETFAYSIRYALVPIFGRDFVNACLRPEHLDFRSFKIDPAVVTHCGTETKLWPLRADARATPASSRAPSEAPDTPRPERNVLQSKQFKELRPKLATKATSPESGYGTDTDGGNSMYSPAVSPAPSTWTSINRPETPISMPTTQPLTPAAAVSPRFGGNNNGGATPVKSYTPSELESANALLQLGRKEILHHGLVPPILSSSSPTYPCSPRSSTPIPPSATNARSDNNTRQVKRRLSDLDTGYVADGSAAASEVGGLTPSLTPTLIAQGDKDKAPLFGGVAKGLLLSRLKGGIDEELESGHGQWHGQKRRRFMSV